MTVALHIAGATAMRDQLWGTHVYAFFPPAVLAIAVAALVVVGILANARRHRPAPPSDAGTSRASASVSVVDRRSWLPWLGLGACSAAVFWLLRVRHLLLGDAHILSRMLPRGESFHPDSPLTELVHHQLYVTFGPLWARRVHDADTVAALTTGLGSALAGGFFVVVVAALAAEMLLVSAAETEPPHLDRRAWMYLALCLVAQGYVVLFCGYVENYTFVTLWIALYLWSGLRWLRRRGALLVPGVCLIIAIAFHLLAAILAPSFLVLAATALRQAGRRLRAVRDIAILAAVLGAVALMLWRLGHGYNLIERIFQMGRIARSGELQTSPSPLFSATHLRDFLSEQMLIGPLGALLALAGGIVLLMRRRMGEPATLFLLAASAVAAVVSFGVRDLRLGYARDWDLFAPLGITFATAGFHVFVGPTRGVDRRASLLLALAVSLFHTAPWVAMNTSFDRSFERFKALPLGHGRTEAMVGYWYGLRGDHPAAQQWLKLAVQADPGNYSAHAISGGFYMMDGQYMEAAREFWYGTQLRPSSVADRVWLVDALVRAGQLNAALKEATPLAQRWPSDGQAQVMYGVVLQGVGRITEARSALARAVALRPGERMYATALANVDDPDGFRKTLTGLWVQLAKREE